MKKIITIIIFFGSYSFSFGQHKEVPIGMRLIDSIDISPNYDYIKSAKLYPIKKKFSKRYYNNPLDFELNSSKAKELIVLNDLDKKVTIGSKNIIRKYLLIPPLKPNRFYKLNISHTKFNVYNILREIPKDKNLTFYDETKGAWLKAVQKYNSQTVFKLLYHPSIKELQDLKTKLAGINLNDPAKIPLIIDVVYSQFEILKFKNSATITPKIIPFCMHLMSIQEDDPIFINGSVFLRYFNIPNYIRIYAFYERWLEDAFNKDPNITHSQLEAIVEHALLIEEQEFHKYVSDNGLPINTPIPNFLKSVKDNISLTKTKGLHSFSMDLKTSYARTLTPDFGYISYLSNENGLKGGSPYVGVHIALSPVNKNIPLRISQLSLWQRLSIHTGITLNSLNKSGYRDDFFDNSSLLLGGSYKVLSQSTRINFGGVLFKKTDEISGNSSLAVQPYIGVSIDIEVRKWLQEIIPSFTNIFKKD